MTPLAPKLYQSVRSYTRRLRTMHDEFRMAHFMYSLPEDIRKDIGWPDFDGDRISRGR
ncbi:MAG: hypothetical protein JNK47_05035 [Mesorhizobium sp.]|nr:hypothetical protein [Mesorhizobium sp.]MBL8576568.1 hypothetical protein [Mesorhizobium sp.]